MARIFHADLYGSREEKYRFLAENDGSSTEWEEVSPQEPFYLFVPQSDILLAEYEQGYSMTEAMPVNLLGFQTHRDNIAVAYDEDALLSQVSSYLTAAPKTDLWQQFAREVDYRPFDTRHAYLSKEVTDRPRLGVVGHLFYENLALNLVRQTKSKEWRHALVSNKPTPAVFVEIKDGSSIFPLYLYPDGKQASFGEGVVGGVGKGGRRANLNPGFVAEMEGKLGMGYVGDGKGDLRETFGPEDVFDYMYAVMHSPMYRERYAEFLKIDFPRVPVTGDVELFGVLCGKGAELVALHLMDEGRKTKDEGILVGYPVRGSNLVEGVRYSGPGEGSENGRVWVNKEQYFEGVPREVWDFHVGGYRVAEKWLKDRKGRVLTGDDREHYRRVVGALWETGRVMGEIDGAIGEWPLG